MKQRSLLASLLFTFTFLFASMLSNFYMQKAFARDLPDTFLGPAISEKSNVQPFPDAPLYAALFQPIPPAINQITIEDHQKHSDQTTSRSIDFAKPSVQDCKYVIQPGDSLHKIASSFHIDEQQLIAINNITNPSLLYAGETLQIPVTVMNGGALNGAKTLVCTLTAYTSGYESTGKNPGDIGYGVTSTGTHVAQGRTIAVDPSVIPYGSRVFIPGLGIRIAEDTGGAIRGARIDVYFDNLNTALSFGVKRDIPVYILPKNDTYASANSGDSNTNPPA